MSVDVSNMSFQASRGPTEVWQSVSADAVKLPSIEEGTMVQTSDAKAVLVGDTYYVPIVPRGWVSAKDLDGFPWPAGEASESGGTGPQEATPGPQEATHNPLTGEEGQEKSQVPEVEAAAEDWKESSWNDAAWSSWQGDWGNDWQWTDQQEKSKWSQSNEGARWSGDSRQWWESGDQEHASPEPIAETPEAEQVLRELESTQTDVVPQSSEPAEGEHADASASKGSETAQDPQPSGIEAEGEPAGVPTSERQGEGQHSEESAGHTDAGLQVFPSEWHHEGDGQAKPSEIAEQWGEGQAGDWWGERDQAWSSSRNAAEDDWEDDGWLPQPQPQEAKKEPMEEPTETAEQESAVSTASGKKSTEEGVIREELQEGMHFRSAGDVEVRQAANPRSNFLKTLRAGDIVELTGKPLAVDCTLNGVTEKVFRVPIKPRGWINVDALQPLSGAPGLVAQPGNVPKTTGSGGGFENFEAVFDEPSAEKGSKKAGKSGKKGRGKDHQEPEPRSWEERRPSKGKGDPLQQSDPWSKATGKGKTDPQAKNDSWARGQSDSWSQASGKEKMHPLAKNDKWARSGQTASDSWSQASGKEKTDPLANNDPWARGGQTASDSWSQASRAEDPLAKRDPWAQGGRNSDWNQGASWSNGSNGKAEHYGTEKSWKQESWTQDRDPVYENDPWATSATPQAGGRALQPWQPPKEAKKEPSANQQDFLEAAVGKLDQYQEEPEWDQFKANEALFGVKSSYNEASYTTPLDQSKVPRRIVVQAEEIAKEVEGQAGSRHLGNGQGRETRDSLRPEDVEILSSEDEEARFSAVAPRFPVATAAPAPRQWWHGDSGRRYGKGSPAVHLQDFQSGPLLDAYISQKYNVETQEEEYHKVIHVLQRTQEVVARAGLRGTVETFGSAATGFKTSGSDVDMAYTGAIQDRRPGAQVAELSQLVRHLKEEFEDITSIFGSKIPVVKFYDPVTQLEVDFCIKNDLGIRNSKLLDAYCRCDPRVPVLGKLVKDWTKTHELVGVPDGCLNSYAYMLMMIHYLQSLDPPVVVNLQELASEPHIVKDAKWGTEHEWDTKFFNEVEMLQPSDNRMSNAELLFGFFSFYGRQFQWSSNAVCIRLNGSGRSINKFALEQKASTDQWYIEDPFDLRHNLASGCSAAGRRRILKAMHVATSNLLSAKLKEVCGPSDERRSYFLKCKVDANVTAEEVEELFQKCDLVRLHLPVLEAARTGEAFLEFDSAAGRRKGHSRNGGYVGSSRTQLQLMQSSKFALEEAMEDFTFRITDLKFSRAFQ